MGRRYWEYTVLLLFLVNGLIVSGFAYAESSLICLRDSNYLDQKVGVKLSPFDVNYISAEHWWHHRIFVRWPKFDLKLSFVTSSWHIHLYRNHIHRAAKLSPKVMCGSVERVEAEHILIELHAVQMVSSAKRKAIHVQRKREWWYIFNEFPFPFFHGAMCHRRTQILPFIPESSDETHSISLEHDYLALRRNGFWSGFGILKWRHLTPLHYRRFFCQAFTRGDGVN